MGMLLAVAWCWLRQPPAREVAGTGPDAPAAAIFPAAAVTPSAPPAPAAMADSPPAEPQDSRQRVAYRLQVTGDRVTLAGRSDLRGDFKVRRGPLPRYPGMLHCALVDAAGKILAEDTVPQPDRRCQIFESGPAAVRDAVGPRPVLCQVRLPQVTGAKWLEVHRLTDPGPPRDAGAAPGQLLARLPLDP